MTFEPARDDVEEPLAELNDERPSHVPMALESSPDQGTATSVVGLQWGDEAKGKLVDLLADHHDVVVRYQGGANAGHTIVANGVTYKLSLVPTGIIRPDVICVVGNGVVIDPDALWREIDTLSRQNIALDGRLWISDRAHLILPWHIEEERLTEDTPVGTGAEAIGTTRRGIGPCYRDKAGRSFALRMADLVDDPQRFRTLLARIVPHKNRLLQAFLDDFTPFDVEEIAHRYSQHAERLRPYLTDTVEWLHQARKQNKRLLFEGAQGAMLDVDHGSYPYVTGSNAACGLAPGSGVPSQAVSRWIGVAKAYSTRVGSGPFPTELTNEVGQRIREVGREYGTVTGRPRRCGWFDAVMVRRTAQIVGVNQLAVMLLDVLSGLPELKVAIAYEDDSGRRLTGPPANPERLAACRPIYQTLPGWTQDLTGVRTWSDLPEAARGYVEFLAEAVEVPVKVVSVGPDRLQTIFKDHAREERSGRTRRPDPSNSPPDLSPPR
mgnify:CR=1 FL=1